MQKEESSIAKKAKEKKKKKALLFVKSVNACEDTKHSQNVIYAVTSIPENKETGCYILYSLTTGNKYRIKVSKKSKNDEGETVYNPNFVEIPATDAKTSLDTACKNFKEKISY